MKLKKTELWIVLGMVAYVAFLYRFERIITGGFTSFGFFKLPPNSIWFSFTHAILAALVVIYFFRIVEKTVNRNTRSMTFISYYTICAYNMCSSCKYIISPLFPGLVEDNLLRFFGSVLADGIIVISLFIWDHINRKHYDIFFGTDKYIYGNKLLYFALIVLYTLEIINLDFGIFPFMNIENGTLAEFIKTFMCSLCMLIAIINLDTVNSKSLWKKIGSFLPVLVIFIVSATDAVFTGKRNDLIIPVVYFVAICYGMGKLNVNLLRTLTSVVPIGVAVVSQIIFSVSGRYTRIDSWYIRDQVYRFDLMDLAITISNRFKLNYISLGTIWDGIISAIPGVHWESIHYANFMGKLGLDRTADYSDTIFSMGAELFGLVGMILIPILILIYMEWLDNRFKRSKHYNIRYIRFLIVFYFTIAETTWSMFILYTRNMLLSVLLGTVFLGFVLFVKKKRRN